MDTYKLKRVRLQSEIDGFLGIKTRQNFAPRTIAKALKVSPTAISNAVKELEKEKKYREV